MIGQTSSGLYSQGFDNAANMATGQFNAQASNAINAGQISTTLPALASSISQTQRGNQIDDIMNKLSAGNAVQSQNQKLLDAVTGQYSAQDNFDLAMVQALAQLLAMTPTAGGATSQTGTSDLTKLGTGGIALGDFLGSL
ncbi:MAG: hypothetical protein MRY32_04205 [Rickettsiales bacterium]|nr:hypothetical protein [Rickettsiales bacterium]